MTSTIAPITIHSILLAEAARVDLPKFFQRDLTYHDLNDLHESGTQNFVYVLRTDFTHLRRYPTMAHQILNNHGHAPESQELSRIAAEIQEATMTSPGSGMESARGTLWGAVNGVTFYADHMARSRSDSNRLFSAWFGDGERMKNSAVRVAVEMAGIQLATR